MYGAHQVGERVIPYPVRINESRGVAWSTLNGRGSFVAPSLMLWVPSPWWHGRIGGQLWIHHDTLRSRYFTYVARKVHFSRLILCPNLHRAAISSPSASKYSLNVLAWTRLSSIYNDMFERDEVVTNASAIHREKIYPTDVRPKAIRVY